MKLGVFSPVFSDMDLSEALKYLSRKKVDCIELGVGGYPGTAHADAKELIKSPKKLAELKKVVEESGVHISALSVHGNCVHPDKKIAAQFEADFSACLELASMLDIKRVVTFSGCPGDGKGDNPNWVTCPWPPEFSKVLEYQWEQVLIPYWTDAVKRANRFGVSQIALEMHPGFCVYNPSTLLRLRAAVGNTIGANLDPSHLLWQGIDIEQAIFALSDAIYFFHAKDTAFNKSQMPINGVLDNTPYGDIKNRSWVFRTVGYGEGDFKKIISALKAVGYDDIISIEHEDGLMGQLEGLDKAIDFLQQIIIRQKPGQMYWA